MRHFRPFDPDRETAVQYICRLEATINRIMLIRLTHTTAEAY